MRERENRWGDDFFWFLGSKRFGPVSQLCKIFLFKTSGTDYWFTFLRGIPKKVLAGTGGGLLLSYEVCAVSVWLL